MAPVTIDWAKIDNPHYAFERFPSRRSVVYGTKGIVACSQVRSSVILGMSCETYNALKPLACQAGLEILNHGGNASELDASFQRGVRLSPALQWMPLWRSRLL